MKIFHHNEITKIKLFAVELLSCRAAKLMYITMVLLMNMGFVHAADTDLDVWNSLIDSESADEACSAANDDCGALKKEAHGIQDKNFLKKQKTLIKTSVKTKTETVQFKSANDIKNDLKTVKKKAPFRFKNALGVIIGMLLGFIGINLYRKWRKNNG